MLPASRHSVSDVTWCLRYFLGVLVSSAPSTRVDVMGVVCVAVDVEGWGNFVVSMRAVTSAFSMNAIVSCGMVVFSCVFMDDFVFSAVGRCPVMVCSMVVMCSTVVCSAIVCLAVTVCSAVVVCLVVAVCSDSGLAVTDMWTCDVAASGLTFVEKTPVVVGISGFVVAVTCSTIVVFPSAAVVDSSFIVRVAVVVGLSVVVSLAGVVSSADMVVWAAVVVVGECVVVALSVVVAS